MTSPHQASFQVGGPVAPESPVYVERQSEIDALHYLRQMNDVKVIAPRQQGKTSLIYRLRSLLSGHAFCVVNLTTCKANEEGVWCAMLHHRLAPCLNGGRERGPAPVSCVGWYDYFLAVGQGCLEDGRRVIVVLDEIGAAPLAWAESFFSVIRAIYDARLEVPGFGQLTFLFAGAYNPQHLITDPKVSPFNVARSVPLPDFDKAQVGRLVSQLGLSPEQTEALTEWVHHWTDGHPYLTQALCDDLARAGRPLALGDIEAPVRRFLSEDRNLLAPVIAALQRTPPQKEYLLEVLRGERRQFSPQAHAHQNGLELLGAIKGGAGNLCVIRNRIFERAFHDAFPLRITGSGDGDGVTEATLRQAMAEHFTLGELDVLCQDVQQAVREKEPGLRVSREVVGGTTLDVVCLNLIDYLRRRGHLSVLLAAVRTSRPGVI